MFEIDTKIEFFGKFFPEIQDIDSYMVLFPKKYIEEIAKINEGFLNFTWVHFDEFIDEIHAFKKPNKVDILNNFF